MIVEKYINSLSEPAYPKGDRLWVQAYGYAGNGAASRIFRKGDDNPRQGIVKTSSPKAFFVWCGSSPQQCFSRGGHTEIDGGVDRKYLVH